MLAYIYVPLVYMQKLHAPKFAAPQSFEGPSFKVYYTRSPTNESTARTTYRNWTEISMREALDAVNLQGMSASIVYGIPRSTLNDHIHEDVLPGAKAGAPTLLSTREEEEFLCQCADIGYAKNET